MSLHIRAARFEDIPALECLIEESVRALSVDYYSAQQIESSTIHLCCAASVATRCIDNLTVKLQVSPLPRIETTNVAFGIEAPLDHEPPDMFAREQDRTVLGGLSPDFS